MRHLIILFLFAIVSCQNKEDIIVARDLQEYCIKANSESDPSIPMLEPLYYSHINFLIDENGSMYYYMLNIPHGASCGYGKTSTVDFRPEFKRITPDQINYINKNHFNAIFRENVKTQFGGRSFVLASISDTFYSPEWSTLINSIDRDKKSRWAYTIRKMTQEEQVVLSYKKSGKKYDPETIAWDTTKIILPKTLKK
ncbi:hypothetical protein HYN59_10590 [Flavobacterium album]|uniref:Lipoprotein n=1 Tax=Flavobacterium album TaxID=2175091 RepID=A0A2S1QYP9_9FLAO|nr:hypothetical protein [Flavobacterium album]AWH85530.1 hypothetical protein HYN59_10590 [Flavobacterium album]